MKYIIVISIFFISVKGSMAQTASPDSVMLAKAVTEQAETMGKFFLTGDYPKFVLYNNPAIIDMMGGKEKMAEILEDQISGMKEDSVYISGISFGKPAQFCTVNNLVQCTVEQILELKVPAGKMISKTTLIAVSADKGKNWTFADVAGKKPELIKKILPSVCSSIVIPKKPQPEFYPVEGK